VTPSPVDENVVGARLRLLWQLLDDLEAAGDVTVERLETDRLLRHAVERILTQLVEVAVSINSHVAGSLTGRSPATYRESFGAAADAGVISAELAAELAPSAGLRNVLVHEYLTIDLRLVASSIPRARAAYAGYATAVARYLTSRQA
jgi:uncharacterized protein YutE (UPF0331/DUF86 family)